MNAVWSTRSNDFYMHFIRISIKHNFVRAIELLSFPGISGIPASHLLTKNTGSDERAKG